MEKSEQGEELKTGESISTEGKVVYKGRGSYFKNNPHLAGRAGKLGDPLKKTGRKRVKKVVHKIDEKTRAFIEGIEWNDKEKLEGNTLELLGHLLKEANGNWDKMLTVAKELIKLVPKKETDVGPRIINMTFLGNMQTLPDPLDKIEIPEYNVIEEKSGMGKEEIDNLLEEAERVVGESIENAAG